MYLSRRRSPHQVVRGSEGLIPAPPHGEDSRPPEARVLEKASLFPPSAYLSTFSAHPDECLLRLFHIHTHWNGTCHVALPLEGYRKDHHVLQDGLRRGVETAGYHILLHDHIGCRTELRQYPPLDIHLLLGPVSHLGGVRDRRPRPDGPAVVFHFGQELPIERRVSVQVGDQLGVCPEVEKALLPEINYLQSISLRLPLLL